MLKDVAWLQSTHESHSFSPPSAVHPRPRRLRRVARALHRRQGALGDVTRGCSHRLSSEGIPQPTANRPRRLPPSPQTQFKTLPPPTAYAEAKANRATRLANVLPDHDHLKVRALKEGGAWLVCAITP